VNLFAARADLHFISKTQTRLLQVSHARRFRAVAVTRVEAFNLEPCPLDQFVDRPVQMASAGNG
jgi:hypothetical protein